MPLNSLHHAVQEIIKQERSKIEKFKRFYENCMAILKMLSEQNASEEFSTLKRLLTPYRKIYAYVANSDIYFEKLQLQDVQETDTQQDMAVKLANILYANSFLPIYREAIEARLQIDVLGSFFAQPTIQLILTSLNMSSADLGSLYSQSPLSSERLKDLATALTKQKEPLTDNALIKAQALFQQLGTMAYNHSNQTKGLEKTVFEEKGDTSKKSNIGDAFGLYQTYQSIVTAAKAEFDKAEKEWTFEIGKAEEERDNSLKDAYIEAKKKYEAAKKMLAATQSVKTNIIKSTVDKFSIDAQLKTLIPIMQTTIQEIYQQTQIIPPTFDRIIIQAESIDYTSLWNTSLTPEAAEESSSSEEKIKTPRRRTNSFREKFRGLISRKSSNASNKSSEGDSDELSPPPSPIATSSSVPPLSPRKSSTAQIAEQMPIKPMTPPILTGSNHLSSSADYKFTGGVRIYGSTHTFPEEKSKEKTPGKATASPSLDERKKQLAMIGGIPMSPRK